MIIISGWMRVEEHNKELRKGTFNTPAKKRLAPSGKSDRRMFQDDRVKDLDFRDKIASGDVYVIREVTLDKYGIEYVLEAIAQIIAAKVHFTAIKLWTPFGECTLINTSIGNFFVKMKNARTKYDDLLSALESCKDNNIIKKNIKNFLFAKVNDQFCIDASATSLGVQISNCLKKYNKVTFDDNPTAAAICGIFVSEMIRSCGKFVRAAWTDWPKTCSELKSRFLLANERGAGLFRQYLQAPKSVSSEIAAAAKENAIRCSPAKKKMRRS